MPGIGSLLGGRLSESRLPSVAALTPHPPPAFASPSLSSKNTRPRRELTRRPGECPLLRGVEEGEGKGPSNQKPPPDALTIHL